jgi:citronellol/citronellal dehydrogenase
MTRVKRSLVFAESVLDERATLVTGGGTGLGKVAAKELAACGARVVIAGRREEVLAAAVEEIGPGASYVAGDVREPADAERIVRTVLERCGRLDVLVNNAGGQYFVPAEAIEPKGWRAVTRLNVGGTELMSRTAVELAMRPGGGGTIVNVTLSPHHGLAGMTHSSAARAAVEG